MKETVIQLGGAFEATVTAEAVTFNQPVTFLGMAYVEAIQEAVKELKNNPADNS